MEVPLRPSFEELVGCQSALFEWADSFDSKDWTRLQKWLAPTLRVDYRSITGVLHEDMLAEDFIKLVSDSKFLGDDLLKTQHFIGASSWQKLSEDEIEGTHQLRVAHQRYADREFKVATVKGHAIGVGRTRFKNIDGAWKFSGICPEPRWSEYDYDKIFARE